MKRRDLLFKLYKAGFRFYKHGGNHDRFIRGKEEIVEIPRHREINEKLARLIIKKYKL